MAQHSNRQLTDGGTADEPMLLVPASLRSALKEPLGPIETDSAVLLDAVTDELVTVGDVVTYELRTAGATPAVALVDGKTKRTPVDTEIESAIIDDPAYVVTNPPGTITEALVTTLCDALSDPDPVTILVDGEEDLATLPAILAVPDGTSVVYGQPDEGMVHVRVDDVVRRSVIDILSQFDGDVTRLWSLLS